MLHFLYFSQIILNISNDFFHECLTKTGYTFLRVNENNRVPTEIMGKPTNGMDKLMKQNKNVSTLFIPKQLLIRLIWGCISVNND